PRAEERSREQDRRSAGARRADRAGEASARSVLRGQGAGSGSNLSPTSGTDHSSVWTFLADPAKLPISNLRMRRLCFPGREPGEPFPLHPHGARMTAPTPPEEPHDRPAGVAWRVSDAVSEVGERVVEAVKPRLRGWVHAGAAPFVLIASIVLIALAPPVAPRVAATVFGVSAVLLFGTSAVYHRGTW